MMETEPKVGQTETSVRKLEQKSTNSKSTGSERETT